MKQATDYDVRAKHIGLIIGIPQEMYYWTVGYNSTLYIEHKKKEWVAWRETYLPNERERKNHKTIARGNFESVIKRIRKYIKTVNIK